MLFATSLESELFANENVCFAVSDRYGGASVGAFDTLNLGYHVGDERQHVESNHRHVRDAFFRHFDMRDRGLWRAPLYYCEQIHSTKSVIIDEGVVSAYGGCDEASVCLGEADALITHVPYALAFVMVADCNPILLYDRRLKVMGVIHAGRKGVFGGIVPAVFWRMNEVYGTMARDCLIYVGASIRSCCYEVGEEIRAQARILGFDDVFRGENLDLIACLYKQAKNLGLESKQIEISPFCSSCEEGLYSYRRERTTGRFGLFAMLRE